MKCRSINYAAKGRVDIVDIELPEPAAEQVQVQGLACGVCAWDIHVYKNGWDGPMLAGHEGLGRVVKVGAGAGNLKEGDWVAGGPQGFAEYCNAPARQLYKIPDPTRRPREWIVEPVACIVTGLDHCNLKAGDRIAVVGCGFMGLMFIQALAHALLDRLIAIDTDPQRLQMAREFGATDCVNAAEVDIPKLAELQLDTVVDASGNQQALELSSKIVRPGGRLNLFGWNHGTATFPGDLWHMSGLTVINSAPASAIRDPWPPAIRLLHRRFIDLRPLVSHVVPLGDYPALLKKAATPGSGYLKGVVELAAV